MLEVKWKSSTATSISKILPRLPIDVEVPRPTYAVCQNLVPLRQNLTLDFSGFNETLTFRWEQIGGSLVDINNPTSLDATIDLINQPPDDRFFRLIVNEGRTNEVDAIVSVFSRIISTATLGLSSPNGYNNAGVYSGTENISLAVFTPRNENFSSCSVIGIEYADILTTANDPSSIESIIFEVWDSNSRQWLADQTGDTRYSNQRFVVLDGFSYRLKILWKRSQHSPTLYRYYSDIIKYTGQFEGFPTMSSKGGNFNITGPNKDLFWEIERIIRTAIFLNHEETPVQGFSIESSNSSNISVDRLQRFRVILDDPEQTEEPISGFALESVINYYTFNIERVSGINISV